MISFEIYNDRACYSISRLYFDTQHWTNCMVSVFGGYLVPGFVDLSTAEREHILRVFNRINNHGLEL